MKIHAIWRGDGAFIMSRDFERDKGGKRFILDREYEIDIKTKRSIPHHAHYWVFLNAFAFHFGETPGDWHEFFKQKLMKPHVVEKTMKNGTVVLIEKRRSEAFDTCTQEEFTDYYQKVQRLVMEWGHNPDEIISTYPGAVEKMSFKRGFPAQGSTQEPVPEETTDAQEKIDPEPIVEELEIW